MQDPDPRPTWPCRGGARSPALELQDLTHTRGERRLFEALHAVVHAGEVLRVQGANGAGKTSLLRLVCGLARPDHGAVLWQGRRIGVERERFHRHLIYLGHAPALKDNLSALENLQSAHAVAGLPVTGDEALHALVLAGLDECDELPARSLSQGQRKRVALARLVFGRQSPLWVLDEPFNALDDAATQWLRGLIEAHAASGGVVVLTSHQDAALDPAVGQVCVTL